jgi:2-methylisocitrate lyase-like PEP mutase family enzyme
MNPFQTLQAKAEAFRQMHLGTDVIVLPNAWDHASATLMVAAGFPVIATTSAGIAFAQGHADGERLGRARMLELTGRIAAQSTVPVTADLEAGYGSSPEDVAATVAGAIEVGLVGCNIEDSDPQTGRLLDFDLAVSRIRAGRAAADKLKVPFVLNARTDPYLARIGDARACFAEAVRRANAFLDAGAACAFVPGPGDGDTVGRLVTAIHGPLNVLSAFAGRAGLSLSEARRVGVRRLSIGGSLMLTTVTLVRRILADIRTRGDFGYAVESMTNSEMNALMETLPSPLPHAQGYRI